MGRSLGVSALISVRISPDLLSCIFSVIISLDIDSELFKTSCFIVCDCYFEYDTILRVLLDFVCAG